MGLFGFGKNKDSKEIKTTAEEKGSAPNEGNSTSNEADPASNEVTSAASTRGSGSDEALSEGQSYYFLGIESQENGDDAAAQQFFTQSAQTGYAPAQFQLGLIYENGTSAQEPDKAEAIKWYKLAADQDDAAAQFNLGYIYYNDPEHRKEGLDRIQKAAASGDEAAQEFLDSVKSLVEKKIQEEGEAARRKVLLKKLMTRNELFFTYSTLTQHPFVEADTAAKAKRVFIFTSEVAAHAKASELASQKMPATTVRYLKKDYLNIFGELYTLGVNSLRINDGGEEYDPYLYELVRRRDFSDVPSDKRPVDNPDLQFSMLSYMQEFRRDTDDSEKDEVYRQNLDRSMVDSMVSARYLIAFRQTPEDPSGKTQYIVMSNNSSGTSFVPVFTDNIEYHRFKNQFAKDTDLQLMAAGFGNMAKMTLPEEVKGFLINPMTTAVPLPQEYMTKVSGQKKI